MSTKRTLVTGTGLLGVLAALAYALFLSIREEMAAGLVDP